MDAGDERETSLVTRGVYGLPSGEKKYKSNKRPVHRRPAARTLRTHGTRYAYGGAPESKGRMNKRTSGKYKCSSRCMATAR